MKNKGMTMIVEISKTQNKVVTELLIEMTIVE